MWFQTARTTMRQRKSLWICALAGLAAVALVPVAGEGLLLGKSQSPQENAAAPATGAPSEIGDRQAAKPNPETPITERPKTEKMDQAAEQSAELLKLATDLKAEVDKTTKDELSLAVIRKASELERLAHNLREKSKLPAGAN